MLNNAFSASSSHIRGVIAMFSQLLYCNVHVRKMTRNSYCFSPWIDRSNQDRVNSAAGKDWRTNELSSYLFQEASWRTVYTDITISRREPETRLFYHGHCIDFRTRGVLTATFSVDWCPLWRHQWNLFRSSPRRIYQSFFFPWEANQFSCDFYHWYIRGSCDIRTDVRRVCSQVHACLS